MSNKENEKFDDKLSSRDKPSEVFPEDPLADTSGLISLEIPHGVDRRSFLMRSAVGGAAAVMTGCSDLARRENSEGRRNIDAAAGCGIDAASLCRLGCREEGAGARADDGGRVLQSGARTIEFAHDWSDAHHLRFLPASHQTAGRQTRQGDEASGEPVRKPQRDGQGARHGTSRARRAGRERTGNGRPEISRRLARQA